VIKNIKRYKRIGIVFICIIAISLFFINNSSKNKIVRLVNNNRDFLNECIENKDYDKIYKIKGIKNIQTYSLSNNALYIDFYCFGVGLVPSSTYYGFYYVSDDKPLGFQASSVKLEPGGDGWKWREANGDNCYYTEKILDHWYYYKAGF
jgi:hypothetical protein